ncbi:MAG: hypothetical protein IJJ61_06540 [Clostridia bacterium]|nr:hypothetical protein [Clostridia bacterium]
MARISQMQGVPAHIEYLKKTDSRRHPSYCIFSEGKGKSRKCKCKQSPMYLLGCHSAAGCDFYERRKT